MYRYSVLVLTAISFASGQVCELSGGTTDPETGECTVCLNDENCCALDLNDFSLNCEEFCTTIDGTSHCGTASCVASAATSSSECNGSIAVNDASGLTSALDFTFSCSLAGVCTCDAQWDTQDCAECSGPGEGYDCSNVGGPCVGLTCGAADADVTGTTGPSDDPSLPDTTLSPDGPQLPGTGGTGGTGATKDPLLGTSSTIGPDIPDAPMSTGGPLPPDGTLPTDIALPPDGTLPTGITAIPDGTFPPTTGIPRPYRTDENFLASVEFLDLGTASSDAMIPIGAMVGDGEVAFNLMETYVPVDFNMVVPEDAMDWNKLLVDETVLGEYNFSAADRIVDYAVSVGARVRGTQLVSGSSLPAAVNTAITTSTLPQAETAEQVLRDHITAVANHFGEKVNVWDVVYSHLQSREVNVFYEVLGDDYVKTAFQIAREVIPGETLLVWNEDIESFSLDDPNVSWWLETLAQYKAEGIPVDGIGVQGRALSGQHNTDELAVFLQTVAELGYFVEVTELDARISLFSDSIDFDPFTAQGEYFKKYASACLNSGACAGITIGGLTDSLTQYDSIFPEDAPNLPHLIDEDGFKKPAWTGVRDALVEFDMVEEEIDLDTNTTDPLNITTPFSGESTAIPSGETTLPPVEIGTTVTPTIMNSTEDDPFVDGTEPDQPIMSTPYPPVIAENDPTDIETPIWDEGTGAPDVEGFFTTIVEFFNQLWAFFLNLFDQVGPASDEYSGYSLPSTVSPQGPGFSSMSSTVSPEAPAFPPPAFDDGAETPAFPPPEFNDATP